MEAMHDCDEILAAVLLGRPLDDATAAHARACARCRAEAPVVATVARLLAASDVEPPADLSARVCAAAAPLLAASAARRTRPAWATVARALGAALLPLPALVLLDVAIVRGAYALLSAVLPGALSFYLVLNYATLLALLLGLTYGAIPVLAERQARLRFGER
jgi:hypothetical protein